MWTSLGYPSLLLVAASLAVAGCGGSDDSASSGTTSSGSASSRATSSAATTAPAPSPAQPATGDVDGTFLCTTIKALQADLGASAPPAAYQAQYVLRVAGLLEGGREKVTAYLAGADAAAKGSCPTEYAAFLTQAGINTLTDI